MATTSPWPLIHAEREALIADLGPLTGEQWATRSLCDEWTVRDVLGHMIATAKMTPPKFFISLAAAGFRFNNMTAKGVAAEATANPADGLANFRSHLKDTTAPPGPVEAMLGEAVIHSADIRTPLGIAHEYPEEALIRVADFYKGSNLIVGAKQRINGLTLRATDTGWSTGSGPEVTGPHLSLILAMTGRSAALAELSGTGVDTLKSRS
jgi:uncharacterized protein (TIGR03083 family)